MTRRYEYLTVRFRYSEAPLKTEKELEGFLDNLKIPLIALYKAYGGITDTITLKLTINEKGHVGAVVEVTVPADSDTLAEHVRQRTAKTIEDTYTMFPDKIEIIYHEEEKPIGGEEK